MHEILIGYIRKQLLGGQTDVSLSPEDDLLGSGLIDSLGMIKLLGFIEEHFELKVPPQDMTIENFMTVEAMANYLERIKKTS